MFYKWSSSEKFRNIHRKTPVWGLMIHFHDFFKLREKLLTIKLTAIYISCYFQHVKPKCFVYITPKSKVSLFLSKLQAFRRFPTNVFSCESCEIFKNTYFNTSGNSCLWRNLLFIFITKYLSPYIDLQLSVLSRNKWENMSNFLRHQISYSQFSARESCCVLKI